MDKFQSFANGLRAKADQLTDYQKRLVQVRGGNDDETTDALATEARILRSVAQLAEEVACLPRPA